MTSMPATYLQFDSTFRNRNADPLPSVFTVPVEGTSNYFNSNLNDVNARDSVGSGTVQNQKKWASNSFELYKVGETRTDPYWSNAVATSGTLAMKTTSDVMASADGSTTLLFGISSDVRPQFVKDYYVGCKMDFSPDGGTTFYVASVKSYTYLGDGRCLFVVSQRFTQNIPAGTVFTMSDPTDISSGFIFVPAGEEWDDAYVPKRIIFNDTLNEWRPIQSYDKELRTLQVYEGPQDGTRGQDGSIKTTGSISHWSPQSTFSIRQVHGRRNGGDWAPPLVNSNGGLALGDPSPVNVSNDTALWFEPKQFLTSTAVNLGPNVSSLTPKQLNGAWIELTPDPGGISATSKVNYQDTCTAGSTTTTAKLTVGPNATWTQDDFYVGQTLKVDTFATGSALTLSQNTGVSANFVATSYTVTVGTNNVYSGTTGTGMTFTLLNRSTGADDVVSATIINPGSGYLVGETITIDNANMILITGIPLLTLTDDVEFTINATNAIGASEGCDRLITAYDSASKTISFEEPLPEPLLNTHLVSIHPVANGVVNNGIVTVYPDPHWRTTPFMESSQITDYVSESGTLFADVLAGASEMILVGASKRSYTGHWISWKQNGGCYARMIKSAVHNDDGTTTVGFNRPIGGVVKTISALTAAGTGYSAVTPKTTMVTTGKLGGSGLTVNTTLVGPAPAPLNTISLQDAGNHYSVGDTITVVGGNNDATFTVTAVEDVPKTGTVWHINSAKTKRSSAGGQAGNGFTTNMNMQQWLINPFFMDNAVPFSLSGSNSSLQAQVCYEIELVSLIVPNAKLQNIGSSGRLAYYPFLYVSLSSPGSSGGTGPNTIMSNNPYSHGMQFIAPIDDVNHPDNATFLKLDGDGMVQTMKFNPYSTLQLKVTLANGEPLQFKINNTSPPQLPDPRGQIQAVFSLKRIA